MTHVAEVCMKVPIIIHKLNSSIGLKRLRETKMDWGIVWPTPKIQKKFNFLPADARASCGETFPRGPATQSEYILLITCMNQNLSFQK